MIITSIQSSGLTAIKEEADSCRWEVYKDSVNIGAIVLTGPHNGEFLSDKWVDMKTLRQIANLINMVAIKDGRL